MNKVRRINFYPDEWISGTTTLKADQRGCYITLLAMLYSRGKPVPDHDRDIALSCNVTVDKWRSIREVLLAKGKIFVTEDGEHLSNKRAETELEKASNRIEKAQVSGAKGGQKSGEIRRKSEENRSGIDQEAIEKQSKVIKKEEGVCNEINSLSEADASRVSEPNHQPSTINHQPISSLRSDTLPVSRTKPPDETQAAFDAWNRIAAELGLPKAQVLTATRRTKLRARLAEAEGLPGWEIALSNIRKSPFLLGGGERGWRADLDFMLQEKSFHKLMDGSYERNSSPNQQRQAPGSAPRSALHQSVDRLRKDPRLAQRRIHD
jgi:uncharacterized protein YdaU (DUF1376 family)